MKHELNLVVSPKEAANEIFLKEIVAKQLSSTASNITFLKILKRSVDARSRNIKINLKIAAYVNETPPLPVNYKKNYPM